MKNRFLAFNPRRWVTALIAVGLMGCGGCRPQPKVSWQGYLEGEFIYVSAPLAGQLETLAAAKGTRVEAGAPLFVLERNAELALQRQAEEQLHAAQARVADVKKGARPTEMAGLEAQVEQARANAELAQMEFERIIVLHKTNVVAESEYDRTRLNSERAARTIDQLSAQLATARMGAREDVITAAEAEMRAAGAAKDRADWSVAQKSQVAPRAALVYDTLYRAGEFVAPGSPVVALLALELLRVRFFVSETDFAALRANDEVHVTIAGRAQPLVARISYLSPKPEYTPPVLYNRDNRTKLVFMIEATVAVNEAADLHPGQPVEVTRSSGARN